MKTFFALLATTARRERFLLRPFRSQGLAVDKLEDKLEDQLWEDRNLLIFAEISRKFYYSTGSEYNYKGEKEIFSAIRTTATMNTRHDKVNPYSCHSKNTAVNWSS